MQQQFVVIVDESGSVVGTEEKMAAHRKGLLHRAFSIFIFNSNQEMLLQRRANHKYHSGGLWTNTCCSHPHLDESFEKAAHRRLDEEMGMRCALEPMFQFTYRAELDQGMIEHEFDKVFFGYSDRLPKINPEEVSEYRYISLQALQQEMDSQPRQFTEWFKIAFSQVHNHWLQRIETAA